MAVITISKEYASYSEVFAQKLAAALGYTLFDKDLIAATAKELGISQSETTYFKKEQESRFLSLFDKYAALQDAVDRSYGRIDNKVYYEAVSRLVSKAAQNDNTIIMGWGGQCILKDHSRAVHVRIVKKPEERIAWLKKKLMMDERSAQDLIERQDEESAAYTKHAFNQAWDDSHLYHFVFNLSKVSVEDTVSLLGDYVKRHKTP